MHPVVVLTGGLGTRVSHLTGPDLPKAMLPIAGHRFIDFKLAGLAAEGVDRVVLLVGHGAPAIRNHVGDGRSFGLSVAYLDDGPRLLGTGGAVRAALPLLPDRFWVTYGDTLLEVPMAEVEAQLDANELGGVMTVLRNADAVETSNVDIVDGLVTAYEKGGAPGAHEHIDYGMLLFRRAAFDGFRPDEPLDLGEVVNRLVTTRTLGAFEVTEAFRDVGTEERYHETEAFLQASALWQDRIGRLGDG